MSAQDDKSEALVTADTSVVVAVLSDWHEQHGRALAAAVAVTRLPAHVLLESASVLTRLPGGLARPLSEVVGALRTSFAGALLTLPEAEHWRFVNLLAEGGLGGGAIYDALIAATAIHHGAQLLTLDQRALPTYRAHGAEVVRIAP